MFAAGGCATSEEFAERGGHLGRLTSERLERFESERAFRQYLYDAQRETRRQGGWWAGRLPQESRVARSRRQVLGPFEEEEIVVTGTRLVRQDFEAISPITTVGAEQLELTATLTTDSLLSELPQSITNNQERAVDEGDIVKRIGPYLIVLQDGRLFTVNLMPDGRPGLRLVDRENVYRDTHESDWIDEMLVYGRRILVTGYSYQLGATEISIFVMSDDGQLTREGVYYISSNDYYDSDNYATRIVGNNLVFYTPISLRGIDPDMPVRWPLVRRWLRDDEREAVLTDGEQMFDAEDIYRPIQETTNPTVYTVSICPLGATTRGDELNCRSTAFVAPGDRTIYVSPEHVYVWAAASQWEDRQGEDRCETAEDPTSVRAAATLYQVPLFGGDLRAMRTEGMPPNQFAMAAAEGEFRALVQDMCEGAELTYFHAPLGVFRRDRPAFADPRRYVSAPSLETDDFEVRFTEDYVVYGARSDWGTSPPNANETLGPARVVALPTHNPAQPVALQTPHEVIRMERLGNDMVLTGYRDRRGLNISRLDLSARPRVADTFVLEGRFETEGRSHAFNAMLEEDGSGAIGLPTAAYDEETRRYPWESEDSDVTYLTFDTRGQFSFAGVLGRGANADPSYKCEVSCVDWYGNARPIFIGGRVFALTGAHLVEGEMRDRRIVETRRVDLTAQR